VSWAIPGNPKHLALKKKLILAKQLSIWGTYWEIFQITLSIFACAIYIAETYSSSYTANEFYWRSELLITQFFLLDFLFNWFVATSTRQYFTSIMTMIDILTIFPLYTSYFFDTIINFSIFRFIRILRLVRILRTTSFQESITRLKRHLITLLLTLLCLVFLATGIFNVIENDIKQLSYDCKYINEQTQYTPSCDPNQNTYDLDSCDCARNNCRAVYHREDSEHEPSEIKCIHIPFFDCFYFIVVSISTVGYGDINPSTTLSRTVVILMIVIAAILIPIQVKELTQLLSSNSLFREAYKPQPLEDHVVLFGHVNDRRKLERFCKEFFHKDRVAPNAPQFHLVILSPEEPTEEVRSVLVSPNYDTRVTYLIGTPLSIEDLQRAHVHSASAVFFLSNIEAKEEESQADGTATVLRTLAVSDYGPNIQCLIEVINKRDSDILKGSDVDIVLCVDEFKTLVLARNARCPGLSTFIDNLFRTSGGPVGYKSSEEHWKEAYHMGQCMETYYIPLSFVLLDALNYHWCIIVEAIYLEFSCMLIGVFDTNEGTVFLNASSVNLKPGPDKRSLYAGILIAPDQDTASYIAKALNENATIDKIYTKLLDAESKFGVRHKPKRFPDMQIAAPRVEKKRSSRKFNLSMNDLFVYEKLRPGMQKKGLTQLKEEVIDVNSNSAELTEDKFEDSQRGLESNKKLKNWELVRNTGGGKDGVLQNASHMSNHIVIFGCMDNIDIFAEFTNSTVCAGVHHNVIFVGEEIPPKWKATRSRHSNVFFLKGDIFTDINASLKLNLKDAFSVVMLAHRREGLEFEENENLDFEMLFLYLKIASVIPPNVHFTVELTSGQNMSVLNSAAIRNSMKHAAKMAAVHLKNTTAVTRDFNALVNVDDRDSLLDEMVALGQQKQARTLTLSRHGVFATQFIHNNESDGNKFRGKLPPGRSRGSIEFKAIDFDLKKVSKPTESWEGGDAHYNFAIYAAGRAYVPDIVDNLLCQSFFTSMTTNLCETLVYGKDNESMYLISCPIGFVSSYFSDVFRSLIARNVYTMGIYKYPTSSENSVMPFVYTCPAPKTILNRLDKLFVYGNFEQIRLAEAQLSLPFIVMENRKQRLGLCAIVIYATLYAVLLFSELYTVL